MGRVIYYADGKGNWWRTEFAEQCGETVFILEECQGAKGHEDQCWAYSPSGSYLYNCEDGGCGSTPPGHKNYVAPPEMADRYYLSIKTSEEVTDPELIQRLEDDDPPEGDGASITRPLSEDDPMYEECHRRLEEYKREHPEEDHTER